MHQSTSRRCFLAKIGLGSLSAAAAGPWLASAAAQAPKTDGLTEKIHGAAGVATSARPKGTWKPVSDRKIRVGIVGGGFGSSFAFHQHPNSTVAAVSDLQPERCKRLVDVYKCDKTYPSLEELVKDPAIEAVFVATDAPSHVRHCIDVLKHGKHVATAVPAVLGSVEDAHRLLEVVRASGLKYMMFETSSFHEDCYAMRQIYRAGGFGKLIYTEGEYYHYSAKPIPSFHEWRLGMPPQWYPTHATAYYVSVTGGSFTEVSCMGIPSSMDWRRPENNPYKNPFGTEIALLRTSEGGMAIMAQSRDTKAPGAEAGRVRGQRGAMWNGPYVGDLKQLPDIERPPLPPDVPPGGHGGSHGPLVNEFVTAILEDRQPLVDVVSAINMTVPGIIAHASALKGGELLKIPQFG